MNLIEQSNTIKGLTDESLQQEISTPSGSIPPFLVLTEINRRKDQRARYEGEKARKGDPSTVVDDIAGAGVAPPMGGGAAPQGMPPMPGAGAPTGAPGGIAAFADGGPVQGLDFAGLQQRYLDKLDNRAEREDRARALAIITAGAGIAGTGSPNFFTNVGRGISGGAAQYSQSLDAIDTSESSLLRDALGLSVAQNGDELARMRFSWDQEDAIARRAAEERRLNQPPADVRTTEWFAQQTPEMQDAYTQLNPPYNPAGTTEDFRREQQADKVFQDALSAMPQPSITDTSAPGYDPTQVAGENMKRAALLAYPQWVQLLGPEKAASRAKLYGLTDGELLAATTPSATAGAANVNDPLDLGL